MERSSRQLCLRLLAVALSIVAGAPAASAAPAPAQATPAPAPAAPAPEIITSDPAPPQESDTPALAAPAHTEPSAPQFVDPAFGPRYVIESVVVRGNAKTKTELILREIRLRAGDQVDASDARVQAARYRLLALGYFLDARLSLQRGSRRGGGVLLVEVEERGTILINDLFLSTSDATRFWSGLDASEGNFLGRGINLGGGFVVSTTPKVPGASRGLGLRLHFALPAVQDINFSGTALYNNGSEPFRIIGRDKDPNPANFVAAHTRRTGVVLGAGRTMTRSLRLFIDLRQEFVRVNLPVARTRILPGGDTQPVDFQVDEGRSRVASLTATVDFDTRTDPVLPRSGVRLVVSVEAAAPAGPGSYGFVKALGQASLYRRMPFGHVLGFHLLAGAIGGDAPYFDRFFIGDLNPLLPRRALGINFSTQPSRDFLGSGIAGHRYDDLATRGLIDYAVPIWRRSGFVYGGDLFVAIGTLAMASAGDFGRSGGMTWATAPVDLTGDLGLRLDTYLGVFNISIANALGRSPF